MSWAGRPARLAERIQLAAVLGGLAADGLTGIASRGFQTDVTLISSVCLDQRVHVVEMLRYPMFVRGFWHERPEEHTDLSTSGAPISSISRL